jgi:hypothetical protein
VGQQALGEKLVGLLSPWQPVVELKSPGGRLHTSLKSGMGMPDINQKVEPCTGYQINPWSGAKGTKIFLLYYEHLRKRSL